MTYKNTYTDLEISLVENAKIRIPFKPEMDEKTKRIKPESVRPDPKDPDRRLGGIKGTESDLKEKQWIVVALGATREKPVQFRATALLVVADQSREAEKK